MMCLSFNLKTVCILKRHPNVVDVHTVFSLSRSFVYLIFDFNFNFRLKLLFLLDSIQSHSSVIKIKNKMQANLNPNSKIYFI